MHPLNKWRWLKMVLSKALHLCHYTALIIPHMLDTRRGEEILHAVDPRVLK